MERIDGASEAKGHLAVRLSDTKTFTSRDLIDLSLYAKEAFGVKYLTIISGNSGMEREIEIKSDAKLRLFRNFEVVHDNGSDSISVNLINHDSESLFLLKLKDCFASNSTQTSDDDIFKTTLKSFTDFPPIDLFLCMLHDFNFNRLFPLHLSFTHFYCCPVLADQAYSKEAISEGFRKFSTTKQNFGR